MVISPFNAGTVRSLVEPIPMKESTRQSGSWQLSQRSGRVKRGDTGARLLSMKLMLQGSPSLLGGEYR